jgi:aspartokinase/homoserine dehydrogenase 1
LISTLRALVAAGDRVRRVEGILSGSLSLLLGLIEDGEPFSAAVRTARGRGFTEPDPRDDLSGLDVARKLLVLAREMGRELEPDEIAVESLIPAHFDRAGSVGSFLGRLPGLDAEMAARIAAARERGEALRYLARIDEHGCRVGVEAVPLDHPLASVRDGENGVCFSTDDYAEAPLVVRGFGAGTGRTAAALWADVASLAQEARR